MRRKILFVSGMVVFALIVEVGLLSRHMLLGSNAQVEESLIRGNVERVRDAIAMELDYLGRIASDRAANDDAYEFVRSGSGPYRAENLSAAALGDLSLDLITMVDTNGVVVCGRMTGEQGGGGTDLPPYFAGILAELGIGAGPQSGLDKPAGPDSAAIGGRQGGGVVSGLMPVPGRWPMLIAARPVLTGAGRGPPAGVLVMGRFLDLDKQKEIIAATRQSIDFSVQERGRLSSDSLEAHGLMQAYGRTFVSLSDETRISGYEYIEDIRGDPAFILRVSGSRDLYRKGIADIRRQTAVFLAGGLALVFVVLLLIDRYVMSSFSGSVSGIRNDLTSIAASASPSGRVSAKPGDELGRLAESINEMLRAIEAAQKGVEQNRRQLEQAARLAALGTLVSGVAHEVNNPNNIVALSATTLSRLFGHIVPVLEEEYRRDPDFRLGARRYDEVRSEIPLLLNDIRDASSRITSLVNELKGFARGDEGGISGQADINDVIKSAADMVRHDLEKATTRFTVDLMPGLPPVLGSARRLEQVFVNLIQNAYQALTDRGQGITVTTAYAAADGLVTVSVRDEGAGIAPEDLPHVTEPFFTTRREKGGTGLGLFISSMIVANSGGSIEVDSKTGIGTTVTVRMKTAKTPA